ncbi:MAG: 2-C-methyl-D-erythritol 4-phosphate cytidylyltransferase [Planctomycetes bacterium]|nr:2-C-methyl-D-erythritol 4-phosphate cytidylyltransferase [Planctomycetota bacterium]
MARFAVIIPAAGKGERFGGREKKTFAKLGGKPLFIQTIQLFINRDDVCQTILAIAPEDMDTMKTRYAANLGFMGVKSVQGGKNRCDTVANAIEIVTDEADYIAVHDAARPCAADSMIDSVFAEAQKSGAAIPAIPITSTLKRVSQSNVVEETVARDGLRKQWPETGCSWHKRHRFFGETGLWTPTRNSGRSTKISQMTPNWSLRPVTRFQLSAATPRTSRLQPKVTLHSPRPS